MIRRILKIIISGLIAYPLCYLYIRLENPDGEDSYIVLLLIFIVVIICLITIDFFKKRKN